MLKKNIWILNHHANSMYFNRGGRHYSIAKYLKIAGYIPTIFCSNAIHGNGDYYFANLSRWEEHVAEDIGVSFVFVKGCEYNDNGKNRLHCMIDYYRYVKKAAKEYAKIYGKPDVIIGSSVHPLAVFAAENLGRYFYVPCICEIRDLWPESIFAYMPEKKETIYANWLYAGEKVMYKKADAIIMTWPGGKDYIKNQGWFDVISEKRVFHISNGVDLEEYDFNVKTNEYVCEELNDKNYFNMVYAGSIRKVNNLEMLVDAAKIIQPINNRIRIIVFGDGDELNELRRRCLEENIKNIVFKGKIAKMKIPSILKQCDCTIMHNTSTQLDKYGQSQNKFFEYLAAGRPILMTYSVGYSICEAEKCGIEVKEQNAESIAKMLLKMEKLSDVEYMKMCVNALKVAKKYDYKNLTDDLIDIIENI